MQSTGTSKENEYEKGQYFLSLISESETHILYIHYTQSETFQAFISWNFYDYGLQIMKTQNSVYQKIRILHKINTKKLYFKQTYQASEKYVHFYALNTWLDLLLQVITASMRRGVGQSARGTAEVVWKPRLLW